jgi:membrane-associated PAP2 superfamily phosphatase
MNEIESNETVAVRKTPGRPPILVPLVILIVLTGLVRMFNLDLRTSIAFYDAGNSAEVWPWNLNPVIQFLYVYGTIPAIGAASIAGIIWIASAFRPELVKHRGLAMFMALVMAVGPGLIINAVFKDHFGRPRPRDVEQLGGDKPFLPVLQPDFSQNEKSFPSGHASMGFYWMCLGVFYWERNRRLGWGFLLFGVAYGGLMGFGRIVQGGHWLSDILWAGGFVYLTAWVLYRTLRLGPAYSSAPAASNASQS